MKRKHIVILIIVLLVAAGGFLGINSILKRTESNLESLKYIEITQVDLTAIENGTYSGSYSAFPISAEVNVTIMDHVITGIELVKHSNGQGAPAEAILEKVMESQTLQVDSISGATYSSKVLLKAIESALLHANK